MAMEVVAQDKLVLKNGSRLKGKVLIKGDSSYFAFEMNEFSMLIPWNIVKRIQFDGYGTNMKSPDLVNESNKFYYGVKLGALLSSSSSEYPLTGTIEGLTFYHFSHWFEPGIKLGFENHGEVSTVPIALRLQASPYKSGNRLIGIGEIGYGIAWDNKNSIYSNLTERGGLYLSGGLGYKLMTTSGDQIIFSVMGKSQSTVRNFYDNFTSSYMPLNFDEVETIERIHTMRRLEIGISLVF